MKTYKSFLVSVFIILMVVISSGQGVLEVKHNSPFEKNLPELTRPENEKPENLHDKSAFIPGESMFNSVETGEKIYIYKPKKAFKLVVTKRRYPEILPDKSIYGVISLKITPNYKATSDVIYAKKKYRFDRLSWAIRTGWNETIPFFSRLKSFKEYLKPFNNPVYAHFYIIDVKEYPEYPGQFYHWPREALEDYYLYILQKIDSVASKEYSNISQ